MSITISSLTDGIEGASKTLSGQPSWDKDSKGLKSIFLKVKDLLLQRSILKVSNVQSLGQISSSEARYVLLEGDGLYVFDPLSGVPAYKGGFWRKVMSVDSSPYSDKILNVVVSDPVIINHGLGTEFPSVRMFLITPTGNILLDGSNYTITVNDPNSFTITWDGGMPTTDPVQLIVNK